MKKITAEGVEAFDTLPVLHFGFGNKPETVVDGTRAQSLRAFYRVKEYVPPAPTSAPAPAPAPAPIMDLAAAASTLGTKKKKRPLEEQQQSGQKVGSTTIPPRARKKPTIKASKQQSMNDMLMGFYS